MWHALVEVPGQELHAAFTEVPGHGARTLGRMATGEGLIIPSGALSVPSARVLPACYSPLDGLEVTGDCN